MESKFNYKKLCSEMEYKLPRALKKEKSKKKFKKELKEEMQQRHKRVPMDKKMKALKVYFYKVIHEN